MRWAYGYVLLIALCANLVLRDLIPLFPLLSVRLPSLRIFLVFVSYVALLAVLGVILPGKTYLGEPLSDGSRLTYKCNGLLLTALVVTTLSTAHWAGYIHASWLADNHASLFMSANIFAFSLTLYLFIVGRLSRPRNWLRTRSFLDDFIMGTQLNPFVLGIDIKFFSYRPAMAGWLIVNLSFLCKHYEVLGFITGRMLLYQVLTAWYICDYFINEPKMISTWDIIAEHFGLMLVWGDYVFIIFAFRYAFHLLHSSFFFFSFSNRHNTCMCLSRSIQNMFLLRDTRPISYVEVIIALASFCLGFAIFRGANSQKYQFKRNQKALIWGKPPTVLGGKLLASGFWGMARHMNYTGDLLIALSFCLPCGSSSSLSYFYFIYLLLLTVHREKRDDDRCSRKYKSLWDDYCRHVPYRLMPFVY